MFRNVMSCYANRVPQVTWVTRVADIYTTDLYHAVQPARVRRALPHFTR